MSLQAQLSNIVRFQNRCNAYTHVQRNDCLYIHKPQCRFWLFTGKRGILAATAVAKLTKSKALKISQTKSLRVSPSKQEHGTQELTAFGFLNMFKYFEVSFFLRRHFQVPRWFLL